MQFEDAWQQYDLTESELLRMEWRSPLHYVLHVNYYWNLDATHAAEQVASEDQPLDIVLQDCIRLHVEFGGVVPGQTEYTSFGTIVGWGRVEPSPWLQALKLPSAEWLHLFFQIGTSSRVEVLCHSIAIQRQKRP